jgi:hypothetical protein
VRRLAPASCLAVDVVSQDAENLIFDLPAADRVATLVDAVRSRSTTPTLLLVHNDDPGGDTSIVHDVVLAARSVARWDVLIRVVSGPPTLFQAVIRVLGNAGVPAGVRAVGLELVLRSVHTLALIGSVSKLERPAPSVLQHARSLAPGARFLVQPDAVRDAHRGLPADLPRGRPVLAVAASDDERVQWAHELWKAVAPVGAPMVPVGRPVGRWWGTSRWAELAVLEESPERLIEQVRRLSSVSCSWCGNTIAISSPCPFCGTTPQRHVSEELLEASL